MMIYLNGAIVSDDQARISPWDRGFLLGDGLFETFLTRPSGVVYWEDHVARLKNGAAALRLPIPLGDAGLHDAMMDVLKANAQELAVCRVSLTRGPGPRGLKPPATDMLHPTLMMTSVTWTDQYISPVDVILAGSTHYHEHAPGAAFKKPAYLPNVMARMEADEKGADDAFVLNHQGHVSEACNANAFCVIGGKVVTPPLSDGCLPGVIRAHIIQALDVEERSITVDDLTKVEEAFLTSSPGVRPVKSLDGRPLKTTDITAAAQAIPWGADGPPA